MEGNKRVNYIKDVIENINSLYKDLYNINNELWIIEDDIRDKERNKAEVRRAGGRQR